MPENKKYIIEIPGMNGADAWDADRWERNAAQFSIDNPDANVFEVDTYNPEDEQEGDQYMISIPGYNGADLWDADRWSRNKEQFMADHPDAQIQRVRLVNYWEAQAKENRAKREALKGSDEEKKAKLAELGYYDDTAEEQDFAIDWRLKPVSSAMKTNSVSGETTITDGKLAEFYANDTEHTEQEAEKARLDAEYDANPWVIEQREYEQERRNYINSLKHEIDELSKGVDKIAAGKYRAGALNDMPMSPKNYEKGLEAYRKESALVFAKTMLQDAETLRSGLEYRGGKWASTKDAFNRVISSNSTWNSEEYQEGQQLLLQTFQKLQEHFGSLNEWEPEEMEKVLTPEEMQMVNAFFELSAAEAETSGNTSKGFNVGRGIAANLPFMLEFLTYMGVSEAMAGPMVQGLTKAAAKTLARKAGASLVKRAANTATRQLTRAGIGAAKAAVIGATQTLAQGTTQTQVRDAMLSFDDDGYLTDDAKTAAVAYFDKAIENFSEATGDILSGIIGAPLKGGLRALNKAFKTKAFTNIASAITESVPNKILNAAGFHGFFGEMGEEVVGAAIRDLTISDGNLKHFFEKENMLETALTFLPMTVLGGTFSLGQLGYAKASMSSAEARMRSRLTDYISKDQLDYIISETQSTTPQHMAETMMPVIQAMAQMGAGMKEIEAVRDYMVSAARYQSLMGVQEAKNTAEKEAFKASLEKEVGKFYHAPQVTNKAGETMELSPVVRTVTLKNGKTVYAVSQTNEAGEFLTIDVKTGEQGIAKESDVSESLNKEGKMQKSSITESLNEFLTRQVMLKHRETEADRMSQQYNEQVAGLQELLKEKQGHINLGTEGSPYEVLVDSTTEQGVKCIAPDGTTIDLTWEQVGDALGQPVKLMTDQQIVDNEIADIARRTAERKAELARRKGTAESAEGAVTEAEKAQAKAEEEAKHIPMNPDGTVNETAFWEQDPEGYTQWNDEQNQDNGADSLRQIAASKQALLGLLSEAQKAAQTSVPADRKAAEREIARLQEKIARMEALEAKYAEEKVAPFRERAMKWKELTKAPVYIIETEEELKKLVKGIDEMTGESRVRGFAKDGKAYIYLPGIVDVAEIDAVFMHEAVAHVGLKGMLGEKMFNELLGEVWEMMSPAARRVFMSYPGVNADYLAAADEYVAHIAEKMGAGIADAEEQTIWQKIVGLVRKFLRAIGIELKMTEEELSSLLHQAYANLAENMAKAEQMGKSKAKLSVEESAPSAAQQEYTALAEDLTAEEIKAVAMNDYTAAQEAYDALTAEVPKVNAGESAKDFIARKKAYNEQVTAAKAELDARQALLDEIAKIQNTATEETAVAQEAEEVLEDNGIGVEAIGLDESAAEGSDVRFSAKLTSREVDNFVEAMKANAEVATELELTPENWVAQFGADGIVSTPIGNVKMGDNQYLKLLQRKRSQYFGMIKPTLVNPDIVLEEHSPSENGERDTVMLFIKTFVKPDGSRYVHFESVTIQKDSMEISISSHEIQEGDLKKKMHNDKVAHLRDSLSASELRLNGHQTDGSDLVPTPSDKPSDNKDSANLENASGKTKFSAITPQMDADYLAAVEAGDMETAQRMVLEAAKLAMPNTKLVDKKGNPTVVYHGTKGKFNIFAYSREDIGFHFGTKGTARTRIGRGKNTRIMQVFLNLENPLIFDTDLGSWDADYIIKDLLKKEVMSYDDAKAILLTPNGYKRNSVSALAELRQWMSNNGYDGIIYPNWYESNGKDSYIAFSRSQIKSADPVTYDDAGNVIPLSERFNPENPDIRFSTVRIDPNANQQAEGNVMFSTRRGSLVGIHNISEDKLRKVIKQGGSANPSAAVIDIERQSFDSYGEISFIMPSSLVDAGTGRNAGTFTADAWTPIYPQVSRRFSDDKLQRKYWRDISAIPEEMSHEVRMAFDSWLDNRNASGLAYMFLHERGEAPEMVRVAAKFPQEIKDKMSAILGEGRTGFYELTEEEKQAMLELYIQEEFGGNREEFDKSIADRIQRIEDRLSTGKVPSFVEKRITLDLQWMKEHGYDYDELSKFVSAITADIRHAGEVNGAATTNRALDYIKDNGLEKEFDRWKESLNARYGIKEYLFDGYTPSGNPRWLPNTLENASRLMNKQGLAGATGMAVSFNRFVATLAPKKKTLSDIRASKDLLVEDEKLVDDFREKWSEVFFDLGVKCQPDAKGYEDYGLERLTEAAQKKNPGAYLKKEYGVELSQEDLQKLDEMIKAIKTEFPARYFEIKFQRPVYLNEFAAAVMPTTASEDVKQAVSEAGLPIFEYDSAVEGSRHEATLKATDMDSIRFSVMTPHKSSIDELTDLFHVMNQDQALVPLFDKVAARCREFNLEIEFLDKDEYKKQVGRSNDYGSYFRRKIRFNVDTMNPADNQENAATILHEMIHACTNYILSADEWMLTDENLQAREELDAIFKEVKKRYPSEYGASDSHELLAELSNPSFRAKLKESNLWDRFVNALRKLFGMEAKTDLLARTEDVLDVFLDNPDFFLADIMEPISDEDYLRSMLLDEGQTAIDFLEQAVKDFDPAEGIRLSVVGRNRFGEIYELGDHTALEAANFLLKKGEGYIKGVFSNKDFPSIDMAYGNADGGLYHIYLKHILNSNDFDSVSDMIDAVISVLQNGERLNQGTNVSYDFNGYRVSLAQSEEGVWLLTSFDSSRSRKDKKKESNTTIGDQSAANEMNGTLVSSDSFESKDSDNFENDNTRLSVVSTDADTSKLTIDEIVESGKQKVLEENAAAADVFIRRLYEINGDLAKLRRAAAAQRVYDKNTVQIITRLANELLENGALSDVTRYEIKRILSVINGAVGRNDLTVSVDRLMDIMIGNQLRYGRNRLDEFMKIRGKKVDARGVEVRGRLDIEGQAIMDAMREGISLDIARLEERIAEAEDRLTDASETVRRNAENDLVGYQLAKRYLEEIKESEAEEKDLRKELKDAGEVHKAGQMTDEAYKEFKKSTYDAIRENRMHRVGAYEALLSDMADMIQKSIKNAGQLRDAEKARVENIHHMANSDLQGMPASAHEQKVNKFWNNPIVRLFTAPFATFEQWMKLFGQKSAEGKGYLYNHFIGAWNKANNEEYLGVRDAHAILDAKVKEVFGGELDRWSDLFTIDKKLPKMKVSMWDDGAMREFEVTQGNLLYIYMVNKMTDGKMKLRRMGITEEDIDVFVKLMDPRFIQLADWMQDEFLPGLRDKYNAVHERMFGAPMAAIDSYFPIKVNSNARTRDVELGTDTESGRPSSITGSIIKRTKNSLALDVLGSNAFDVLLEHIEQMEHWAAFAEFNRDLNTLLSYRLFRNRVQNMSTAYGSGQEAWNSFKETAEIVAGVYRPKTSGIDKALTNAVRGFTAGKISFRLWTALKQTLSMPAFLAYSNPATFAKNIATPWEAWNWAMENLPAFEKRWKSREAGNVRLKKTEADWAIWQSNAMEAMTRWGMTPNAFVDAVTCSIGAKSVYDTMYARYIKDGYSHEKADEKAKLDATTAFNATQQSSESAFLAAVQADRTFVAHMATVFRNNSFGMGRELVSALRQTKDRMKEGFKEESIEFMKKQMMRDGLTAEQATRAAERVYRNSAIKDAARIALFGFGMQFLWNLGGSAVYLLFGDDDEEKRKLVKDAALRGAFGSFESMSFGNLVPEMAASIASGNIKNFHPSLSPAGSDIASLWNEMLKDPVAGTSELVNILVQAGFGVNPQVLANSVVAIVDACDGDMELSKEVGIALLRVLQAPQSNIDKLIMDEIDFTNDKGLDITIDEFAKGYAQYKKLSNASYTWWAYSDENEKKIEDKYIKRFQETAKELRRTRGTEEAQKYYQYVDDEYKEVGTNLRELKKKVEDAAKQGDNVTALEYAKQIQEFTQTPEFKKYSRMAGYEKAIQKLSKAMKDVSDKATRERLEDKMLELRKTMVEELEKIENTEQ